MVTANDLKIKGIQVIDKEIKEYGEAIISHRGKRKYVVIDMNDYEDFLAYKLDRDYQKALEEIKDGKFEELKSLDNINRHIEELKA